MDYARIYKEFLANRKVNEPESLKGRTHAGRAAYYRRHREEFDVVYEQHHIRPRSMGGDDSDENMVALTVREHFFAHLCFAMSYRGQDTAEARLAWRAVYALFNLPGSARQRASELLQALPMAVIAREKARAIQSTSAKKQHKDPNFKEALHSEEAQAKRSKTMTEYCSTDAGKSHMEKLWAAQRTEEAMDNKAEGMRAYWGSGKSKDAREKASQRWKDNPPMADAAIRKKVADKMRAYRAKPEVKKAYSQRFKENNPMADPKSVEKAKKSRREGFERDPMRVARIPVTIDGESYSFNRACQLLGVDTSGALHVMKNNNLSHQEIIDYYASTPPEQRQEDRHKKRCKPVRNVTTGEVFESAKAAGEAGGFNPANLIPALKDPSKTYKGDFWEYVEAA